VRCVGGPRAGSVTRHMSSPMRESCLAINTTLEHADSFSLQHTPSTNQRWMDAESIARDQASASRECRRQERQLMQSALDEVLSGSASTETEDLGLSLAASCSSPFVEPFPPLEEDADIIAMKAELAEEDAKIAERAASKERIAREKLAATAALDADLEMLRQQVTSASDVYGPSALFEAIDDEDLVNLKTLIPDSSSPNLHCRVQLGYGPYSRAYKSRFGGSSDAFGNHWCTPLHLAVYKSDTPAVKYLLAIGASPFPVDGWKCSVISGVESGALGKEIRKMLNQATS